MLYQYGFEPCDFCGADGKITSHLKSIQLKNAPQINICDRCFWEKLTEHKYEDTDNWKAFVKRKEEEIIKKQFKKWWQFWI